MKNNDLSALCSTYGSEGCPCALAILNECLVCSHLQGQDLCDCQWNKYCVYIGFLHDQKGFQHTGRDYLVPVRHLNMGAAGYMVFLTAPPSVLSSAGILAYGLLRNRREPEINLPAVVLATYPDHSMISLAVKPLTEVERHILLETTSFDLCYTEKPAVPGLTDLQGMNRKNVLVVAEDFGQLLVNALIRKCVLPDNRATVLLSENLPVITRKLAEIGVKYLITGHNGTVLQKTLAENRFDTCFSLGTARLHQQLTGVLAGPGGGIPHFTSTIEDILALDLDSENNLS
ncbi:MAG: hypothetical protein ACOY40_18210 [Bacillota bacterium]